MGGPWHPRRDYVQWAGDQVPKIGFQLMKKIAAVLAGLLIAAPMVANAQTTTNDLERAASGRCYSDRCTDLQSKFSEWCVSDQDTCSWFMASDPIKTMCYAVKNGTVPKTIFKRWLLRYINDFKNSSFRYDEAHIHGLAYAAYECKYISDTTIDLPSLLGF